MGVELIERLLIDAMIVGLEDLPRRLSEDREVAARTQVFEPNDARLTALVHLRHEPLDGIVAVVTAIVVLVLLVGTGLHVGLGGHDCIP